VTTPVERTRALLWAGGFLIELARDRNLPIGVRRQAVAIARHFPTVEDISTMALEEQAAFLGPSLVSPKEVPAETDMGQFGPLLWSTRLAWPVE
jgi:hypothetical protein